MRILVVSDIHGNFAALDAVLKGARGDWDQVYCLGDIVGYGPDPGECIKQTAEYASVVLGGNHDLAACGALTLVDFADHARRAMEWTELQLSPAEKDYLARLPVKSPAGELLLSHGSPEDPVWGYIFSIQDAVPALGAFSGKICLFGHTHLPSYFIERRMAKGSSWKMDYGRSGFSIDTREGDNYPGGGVSSRYLLNPGSVGFPRDEEDAHVPKRFRNAVARFALFDTETGIWQFKHAEYDLRDTAARMKKYCLW